MKNNYEVHQIKTYYCSWRNYTYLIIDKITRYAVIVDPSWDLNRIINKLDSLNTKLKAVLLTHSHYDHVNLVDFLVEKFNVSVYMSREEIIYYEFNCNNLKALDDNEILKFGLTEIICILTPGHTVGGMCYLLQDSIFTGDTVFLEGCGMCYNDKNAAEKMFESIQRIKSITAKQVKVYPGHSYGEEPGLTMEQLNRINIYFQIKDKETFINFRTRKNQKYLFDFK